ncbi:lipoyl protein ligase domain-containing protein [Thioalkalivibrio sp.]|uniref:lipoyl protein ligase domain-containing protein n=1 Tax=Thioalkalivibrio sp. TaxID=2093813 RepID=UPI0035690ACF
MNRIRVIDVGYVPPLESMATFHAVAESMKEGDDPVVTLVNPTDPFVSVGLHQDIDQEVDTAYCEAHGLPIVRRDVGGGAVYLNRDQMFFHFVYPYRLAPARVEAIYSHFIAPVLATYQALGVPAVFRPVNDIHVNGRKIGGTGSARINDATVMVGSFMFDFDMDTMARCLKVSSEKFRDKLRQGMEDYMTTLTRELGRPPERERVKSLFLGAIEEHLGHRPEESRLTSAEEEALERVHSLLQDPEWVYQKGRRVVSTGVKIAAGTYLVEGMHKAPGGLIRVRMLTRDNALEDLEFSGDFTVFPADGVERLAGRLRGVTLPMSSEADTARLQDHIAHEMTDLGLDIPGVHAGDFLSALMHGIHRE